MFSEAEKPHILVVDDDSRICLLLAKYLRDQGFVVASAKDSFEADAILEELVRAKVAAKASKAKTAGGGRK